MFGLRGRAVDLYFSWSAGGLHGFAGCFCVFLHEFSKLETGNVGPVLMFPCHEQCGTLLLM